MDEAEVIERVALVADDQTPEVAQPREEALDFPTAAIASERTPVLRGGTDPSPAVVRDHLDAQLSQGCIEWIRIVGAVADEAWGQVRYETGVERGSDKGNLVTRCRSVTD